MNHISTINHIYWLLIIYWLSKCFAYSVFVFYLSSLFCCLPDGHRFKWTYSTDRKRIKDIWNHKHVSKWWIGEFFGCMLQYVKLILFCFASHFFTCSDFSCLETCLACVDSISLYDNLCRIWSLVIPTIAQRWNHPVSEMPLWHFWFPCICFQL